MKVATVLESSLPISMVLRQRGIISVDSKKLITLESSTCQGHPQKSQLPSSLQQPCPLALAAGKTGLEKEEERRAIRVSLSGSMSYVPSPGNTIRVQSVILRKIYYLRFPKFPCYCPV